MMEGWEKISKENNGTGLDRSAKYLRVVRVDRLFRTAIESTKREGG